MQIDERQKAKKAKFSPCALSLFYSGSWLLSPVSFHLNGFNDFNDLNDFNNRVLIVGAGCFGVTRFWYESPGGTNSGAGQAVLTR